MLYQSSYRTERGWTGNGKCSPFHDSTRRLSLHVRRMHRHVCFQTNLHSSGISGSGKGMHRTFQFDGEMVTISDSPYIVGGCQSLCNGWKIGGLHDSETRQNAKSRSNQQCRQGTKQTTSQIIVKCPIELQQYFHTCIIDP